MSPREEAELTEHLRGLEDADYLQTLTIPLFASKPARRPARGKMLRALKWRRVQGAGRLRSVRLADEIRGYLERARDLRAQRALERGVSEEVAIGFAQELSAPDTTVEEAVTERLAPDQVPAPADDNVPLPIEGDEALSTATVSEVLEIEVLAAQAPDIIEVVDPDVPLNLEEPVAATPPSEPVASEIPSIMELPRASREWTPRWTPLECPAPKTLPRRPRSRLSGVVRRPPSNRFHSSTQRRRRRPHRQANEL